VALFNRGEADAVVSVTWAQLGVTGMLAARDLWKRADLGAMSSLSQTVPWRGAALILLSPLDASADAGADAGPGNPDGGVDANPGTGGSTGTGTGGGGGAGASGTGGQPGGTGSGGNVGGGTGGLSGSGGASGTGGGSGSGSGGRAGAGATGTTSSGCACNLGGVRSTRDRAGLLVTACLAAVAVARRRRTRGKYSGQRTDARDRSS
jgi:hypothetical protein